VTVYGAGSFAFNLKSQNPLITGIAFLNDPDFVPNYNSLRDPMDLRGHSGWRYFQVSDIDQQLGYLGWELELRSHVLGSEIALRRNAVPSRWRYRQSGYTYEASHVDVSSTSGLLQQPGHPADIWYVGIYLADQALGQFNLYTRAIPSPITSFTNGSTSVAGQEPGT
jgi:large repetitive protein